MAESMHFDSPEAELAYLRSRVYEKEKEFGGHESSPSQGEIVRHTIKEVHQELPLSIRQSSEVRQTLDKLTSTHEDAQLEGMIAIAKTKGIFHAISVVEKLQDWKHEDDFHEHMVDVVRQGIPLRGVKQKSPMFRALNMTLFEVVMPLENKREEDLNKLISSMEQFYAGMISVAGEGDSKKNYFVLEIANENSREDISFFISVPNEGRGLFEKHLLSIFPKAKLIERIHDYNIFGDKAPTATSVAKISGPEAFSLKTYEAFSADPLSSILNAFQKIQKDGAGAALQIVFSPRGDLYTKRFQHYLGKLEKGERAKEVFAKRSFFGEIAHAVKEIFVSKKKSETLEREAIDRVRQKLGSLSVATNIRIAVSAPLQTEADAILRDIQSAFNQFEVPGVNRLDWQRVKDKSFFRNFTFRLVNEAEVIPLNLKELSTILHLGTSSLVSPAQLKQAKANEARAPLELSKSGTILGINNFQGLEREVRITEEDRLRHLYVVGQTGTGKSTLLKNIILQDINAGQGVCMIDPHGSDVLDVLSQIPPERAGDVIYFDPASTERPIALNMLEYDPLRPEEKTFVVNELFNIFQKLYGKVPESMGPMFEQYFRNATMLVIEDPSSGATLLDVSRVLSNKEYRNLKLSRCKNPIVTQFWKEVAEKAGGEAALANIVPYITSKFDVFLANDIMRPIVAQERSSLNFREIMDGKKILLVNLSKGRLGEINANLLGLIIVGKILQSALARSAVQNAPAFYLHIDEFQNVTTDSIATILSEARKYKLSLTVAHQFIAQLEERIKNAVFGNVGSIISFRVGADDAEYLEKQFAPVFTAQDLMNVDNRKALVKMLIEGRPATPFSLETLSPQHRNSSNADALAETSKLKYGRNREEVESEIMAKYSQVNS